MHRSVLESKTYSKFAAQNTVEMLVTEEIDRALSESSPLIKTYATTDSHGDPIEYLEKFPGVSIEQLKSLSKSKAVQFISPSRQIPYTSIVNPHTGKEIEGFNGVYQVKELIAKVQQHTKRLKKTYGDGIPRKIWNSVSESVIQIDMLLGQGKVADAMGVYTAVARETVRQPKSIKNRVEAALEGILEDAEKKIASIAEAAKANTAAKKSNHKVQREAARLSRALSDTKLAEQARKMLSEIK